MIEKTIGVDRMEYVISVFGSFDQNLRIIESELAVSVVERGDQIHISGEAENVALAEKAVNGLLSLAAKGESIDSQSVLFGSSPIAPSPVPAGQMYLQNPGTGIPWKIP